LSDILVPLVEQYEDVAEDFLNKGLLNNWLNEALNECENSITGSNRFAAVQLLITLWEIF